MYNPKDFFTEDEIKQIQLFGISIANNMIPLPYKDHYMTAKGQMWDIDTYIHGVCKCLTMPHSEFLKYYDSTRYDDNTMCSNLELFFKICYEYKIRSYLELEKVSDEFQSIIVCEAGRGIDVLLAVLARGNVGWKSIMAYDLDKSVLHEMQKYFAGELRLPFTALQINTFNYNFASINEKTVIFGTCHNLTDNIKEEILGNGNLIAILDGEVLKA